MIDPPKTLRTKAQRTAVIHLKIPRAGMAEHMDPAIREVLAVLEEQGIKPAGPLLAYHLRRPDSIFEFELGFPVSKKVKPKGRVLSSELPAAKVVRTTHTGPYEGLASSWGQLEAWVKKNELKTAECFWESYLTDPATVPNSADWRTELNWVLK